MPSPLALPVALANLLLIAVALAASRREMSRAIPSSRSMRRELLLVLLLAFAVRVINPYQPLNWNDEWYYQDQSLNLAVNRLNVFCIFGQLDDCQRFAMFYPVGYPVMLSLSSMLFGFTRAATLALGTMAGTLSVGIVYLIARLLSGDHRTALYAAIVAALIPMHVRYSMVSHPEVVSVLFEGLAVLGALLHARTGRAAPGWLGAISLAFAVTVRREAPLALIPMALMYIVTRYRARPTILPWMLALLLTAPHFGDWDEYNWNQMHNESVSEHESILHRVHPRYVVDNVGYMTYWLDGYFLPFLFTALALIGWASWRRLPRGFAALTLGWFTTRLTIYLFHSYTVFIPRYMITLTIPFALAAGAGAAALSLPTGPLVAALVLSGLLHLPFAYSPLYGFELPGSTMSVLTPLHLGIPAVTLLWIAIRTRGGQRLLAGMALVTCLVLNMTFYTTNMTTDGLPRTYSTAFELERETIDGWKAFVKPDCVVVVPRPMPYRVLWQRPVLMLSSHLPMSGTVAILRDDVRTLLENGACVYIYETQPEQDVTFEMLHREFELEVIERIIVPKDVAESTEVYRELALYHVTDAAT